MEKQSLWPAILRYVRNIGIITVCIFVLAGLSCLPAAWRTFYHLGNRVMLLGAVAMVLGVVSLSGRMRTEANPPVQLPHGRSSGQRAKQWAADAMSSYRYMIAMVTAGVVAAFLGYLIRRAGLSVLGLL